MSFSGYLDLGGYLTPQDLQDGYKDSSVLIIGTGISTKNLIKYKSELRKRFDIIIGLNFAIKDFEDILDFHIVMEKAPIGIEKEMAQNGYRRDLIRVLNYKAIKFFPDDIPIIKARREYFNGEHLINKYRLYGYEGLLEVRKKAEFGRLFYGTVLLQAIHFACILGSTNIFLSGADLMFKDGVDHYYGDRYYRDPVITPEKSRSKIISFKHNGVDVTSTHVFRRSAKIINAIITGECRPSGIRVFDLSKGLLSSAIQIDIDEFFKDEFYLKRIELEEDKRDLAMERERLKKRDEKLTVWRKKIIKLRDKLIVWKKTLVAERTKVKREGKELKKERVRLRELERFLADERAEINRVKKLLDETGE